METAIIGIAEYKVCRIPCLMESISLGSCVGIALFDPTSRVAGLAHIMLPDSSSAKSRNMNITIGKYADTALAAMLADMIKFGALRTAIVAKIAGGACMFESTILDPTLNIGDKNVAAVKNLLGKENINIIAEDVGKNYGRTLQFDTQTGMLAVDTAKFGKIVI